MVKIKKPQPKANKPGKISISAKRAFNLISKGSNFDLSKPVSKILEIFEPTNLEKLRDWTRIPSPEERKRLTNERILNSLKRIGVAPQSEVDELRAKIERLEVTSTKSRSQIRT